MFRKCYKFIGLLFICLFFFIFVNFTDKVDAEVKVKQIKLGEKYYYYGDAGSNYGGYAGTVDKGSSTKATIFKHINNNPAYCVQSENYAPSDGENYYEVPWNTTIEGVTFNEEKALKSGLLMEIIDDTYSDAGEEYVLTYSALNSYFGFNRSVNYSAYNSTLANLIKKTESEYKNNIKPTTSLPKFSSKANELTVHTSGGNNYYTGQFTLSGLVASYGGDSVTYKFDSLPSGVTLYTDSNYKNVAGSEFSGVDGSKTFYVKATGVSAGGEFQITTRASNVSKYYIGRLWRPYSTSSNKQLLITLGSYDYERSAKSVVTFDVPDVAKKTIKLVKKDKATGEYLKGSSLKLQLSGGMNTSCTVPSNGYSCSISVTENQIENVNYSVVETVAPNGYVLGETISNMTWDVNSSSTICYASTSGTMNATELDDCNREYKSDTVCTVDGVLKEGACGLIPDPSLPEDTPEEQITYIPNGTEEIVCYYKSGEGVNVVDGSKCAVEQYIKVTNKTGNLTVEYYNEKNSVTISKYAINGDKELIGAELKICSDKPDEKGNCTIVPNIQDGKCSGTTATEDGLLGLTNEFNCVDNGDGTKTVDMHWFSGSSAKVWRGVPDGDYYLVETVAPSGYLPLTTSIKFTVKNGIITNDSESYDKENKKLIVRNKPTSFKVIKKDASNNKILSGAQLSICTSYKDEAGNYQLNVGADGYCVPAKLSDGNSATWTTDDKERVISGLGIGTYYLVETKAPDKYSTSEPILFTLNEAGTIVDKDGKAIKNNELIMLDDPIKSEQLGEIPFMTVILCGLGAILVGSLSYYFLIKKNGLEIIKNKFKKNK